ncbi:MAG TPA: DUF3810 family protein, partial [Vicinamibacterales bacterium]|nr:DUF3810 family protein [Vicinamibacterales bacterium]
RRWRTARSAAGAAIAVAWDVAVFAACAYLAFLLLWGLNYRRLPAEERFAVEPDRVTEERLVRLGEIAVERVNALYDARRDLRRFELEVLATDLQAPFRRAVEALGQGWQPAHGRPKLSLVARLFPFAGVDGLMNPFALEVMVNPEALPFERPFLLAHEWAHLAGQARESDASFVAWLTCVVGTRDMQYSGWLPALLHVRRSLPRPRGDALLSKLEAGPRKDLEAIRRRLARAEPLVTRAAWHVYDTYLRANRVESGLANYDEAAMLILGSRLSDPYLPEPPPAAH